MLTVTLPSHGRQTRFPVTHRRDFSDSAFLNCLEEQKIHCVIALRQKQPLQRALVDIKDWWSLYDQQKRR